MGKQVAKPAEYRRRMIVHPDAQGAFDRILTETARKVMIEAIHEIEVKTKLGLSEKLGLHRDRVASHLKTLDLEEFFAEARRDAPKRRNIVRRVRNLNEKFGDFVDFASVGEMAKAIRSSGYEVGELIEGIDYELVES
jgi:hypothetical protein